MTYNGQNIKIGDTITFYESCNADRKQFLGKVEDHNLLGFIAIVDGKQYELRYLIDICKVKAKIYHSFEDKYGTKFSFPNYMSFAKWWFNLPYKLQITFPQYKKLQFAAANSKEAKTRQY